MKVFRHIFYYLKVLANKAYPNINSHNLENITIYMLAKGLRLSAWSEHVLYHSPNSTEEPIDIVLGEIFSGCYTCTRTINTMFWIKPLFCRQIRQGATN